MNVAAVFRAWRLLRRSTVSSRFTTSPHMTASISLSYNRSFVEPEGGQRDASQQARLVLEQGPLDTHILDREHANPFLHGFANGLEQQVVERRHAAAEDYHIGVQRGDHVGDADAEPGGCSGDGLARSEEHTSELQSLRHLVC